MSAEFVLDASVAVKCFLTEPGSTEARRLVLSRDSWVAPDHVLLEIASVAAKRLRRGEITTALANDMVDSASDLFTELAPTLGLRRRAYELAAAYGASVYDCLYVALAEERSTAVMTADRRLHDRLASTPEASLVTLLD